MLGPPASPWDWKIASTPVTWVVTPAGALAAIALRVSSTGRIDSNVDSPVG